MSYKIFLKSPEYNSKLSFLSKSRRSQSALEYMMTYGWAILIIVIVAVILYSMGIFNPSSSVTFTSSGFSPFTISSTICNSIGLKLGVIAGPMPSGANSITLTKVFLSSATGANTTAASYTLTNPLTLTPGQTAVLVIPNVACNSGGVKYSFSGNIQYGYSTTAGKVVINTSGTVAGTASASVNSFTEYNLPANAQWTVQYSGVNYTSTSASMIINSKYNSTWKIYPVTVNGVTYYPIYAGGINISTSYNLEVDFIPLRNLWVSDFNKGISMIYYNNNTLAKNSTGGVLLDTGPYARSIIETLNGQDTYFTNWLSNNVTEVSVSNYNVLNNIDLNNPSLGLAITPDGKFIYIADAGSPYVSVISTATNTVVATIPLPTDGYVAGVAITPNGKYVYIGDNGGGLIVISTATNSVIDIIPPSESDPWGVAVSPNGQFVYAADAGGSLNDNVSVISTATNTVVARIPTLIGNSKNLAITPNGKYVYVTGQGYNVSVISTATNTVVANIKLGSVVTSEGIAITPNGNYAYIDNLSTSQPSGSVIVVSTATNQVVSDIITNPVSPCGISYGPIGSSC
ncbi:MAG: hypothetical protein ACP5MV_00310 [Candidatus Parvarchaeum sp.]